MIELTDQEITEQLEAGGVADVLMTYTEASRLRRLAWNRLQVEYRPETVIDVPRIQAVKPPSLFDNIEQYPHLSDAELIKHNRVRAMPPSTKA